MEEIIKKTFEGFKTEAELFFVNELQTNEVLENQYCFCLDVLFNVSKKKDTTKGLIAFSKDYGQGKSFFFDVVHHRVKRLQNKNIYKRTTSTELCEIFTQTKKGSDPLKELNKFINVKNLYIDDIGEELQSGRERSNFGNKLNVLRYVILERYRLWQSKGFMLYGTTNLNTKQIIENYGGRVADRLQQMVYVRDFSFLEGSFRQMSSVRKLTDKEISDNWEKVTKKQELVQVDLDSYFNSMISQDTDKLENEGQYFWNFCCNFLKQKELISSKDFKIIDADMMERVRLNINQDIRQSLRIQLKNAPAGLFTKRFEEAKRNITNDQVMEKCESIIAKRKFLELKKLNHTF